MKNKTSVLVYHPGRALQKKIKRAFTEWRQAQNPLIPMRCDIPYCYFHTNPCIWIGKELKLILDHKNGVSGDNRPKNLQFLCPNCNSQQVTHGGRNKGRVEQSSGGFSIKDDADKKHYFLPVETMEFKIIGYAVSLTEQEFL
jgi:hypothetical protein